MMKRKSRPQTEKVAKAIVVRRSLGGNSVGVQVPLLAF